MSAMRFSDRVAVITGGGGGIGRAISLNLGREGATVVAADIDPQAAEETARLVIRDGGQALAIEVDITRKQSVQALVAEVLRAYGKVDILVNNAGIDIKGAVVDLEESSWDKILDINLKGMFLVTQAVLPFMIAIRYGRIVNMSSMLGRTGKAYSSPYCASKFGVIGFSQAVALEVGKFRITVNVVCPGPVDTEMIRQSIAQSAQLQGVTCEEFLQTYFINQTPLGRIAKPTDVAHAVVFLASDEAAFITGSALNVSGGREMH